MTKSLSPLRYPGGKSKIYSKVKNLIDVTEMNDRTYVEPFAGGFGIGIGLLCDDIVRSVILNDSDKHIYNFWFSILHHTEELLKSIRDIPITIEERERQKSVYKDEASDVLSDGLATLYLNRVNFSGVITGGPIGGLAQNGTYKIDCRFNRSELAQKIERIAMLRNRIELYNCDASHLISVCLPDKIRTSFFYIDPPYVKKGYKLYENYFIETDHKNLEKIITEHLNETRWIVTYDDCELIREIYKNYHMTEYSIQHDVGGSIMGKEIVITNIPDGLFSW